MVDQDRFTEEYLKTIMKKRHVPVKALILDQAVISGVGNWVADESLYHAKLHPEQYCNEFSDEEAKNLYEAIRYVCQTACDLLADSDKFPGHWMFDHRWGKGKGSGTLPNGEKLAWITVGGRTSCYAPAVQKKTGHVAPATKEEAVDDGDAEEKPKKAASKKRRAKDNTEEEEPKSKKSKAKKVEAQESDKEESTTQAADEDQNEPQSPRKKVKVKQEESTQTDAKVKPAKKTGTGKVGDVGRRRSSRLSNGA